MSADVPLMALGPINLRPQGKHSLSAASKHNKRMLREGVRSTIDASRSHLNQSLLGLPATPHDVVLLATRVMTDAGITMKRVDAVVAVEGVFSLRRGGASFGTADYFTDCAQWMKRRFGGWLLSADVHHDEDHPHCHVVVLLPLLPPGVTGVGGDWRQEEVGGEHKANFFEQVAQRYGLRHQPPPLRGAAKQEAIKRVHEHLRQADDPITKSAAWRVVCDDIARYPERFMGPLGIPFVQHPMKAAKTLADFATSAGKGPKTAVEEAKRDRQMNAKTSLTPTSIEVGIGPSAKQPLSCVEVAQLTPLSPLPWGRWIQEEADAHGEPDEHPHRRAEAAPLAQPSPSVAEASAVSRIRDADMDPATWNSETGEYITPRSRPSQSAKAAARAYVMAELHAGIGRRTAEVT